MQTFDENSDKQKLSQLMDGEWLDLNASDCVSKLCEDDELRAKWVRYHMIRDCMKNEPLQAQPDLASRICAAIDDEPVYSNITPFSGGNSGNNSPWAQASAPDAVESLHPAKLDSTVDTLPDDELSAENVVTGPSNSSWMGTGIAGFALAASVAVVTVVGVNLFQQQGGQGDSLASSSLASASGGSLEPAPQVFSSNQNSGVFSQQIEGAPLPTVEFVANTGSYWVTPQSATRVTDEQRLNMMLSQHIENSPTSDRQGLLPYSRLVGYDEIKPE